MLRFMTAIPVGMDKNEWLATHSQFIFWENFFLFTLASVGSRKVCSLLFSKIKFFFTENVVQLSFLNKDFLNNNLKII